MENKGKGFRIEDILSNFNDSDKSDIEVKSLDKVSKRSVALNKEGSCSGEIIHKECSRNLCIQGCNKTHNYRAVSNCTKIAFNKNEEHVTELDSSRLSQLISETAIVTEQRPNSNLTRNDILPLFSHLQAWNNDSGSLFVHSPSGHQQCTHIPSINQTQGTEQQLVRLLQCNTEHSYIGGTTLHHFNGLGQHQNPHCLAVTPFLNPDYNHIPKTRKRDKKMRRPRTNFSDEQLRELEALFSKQKYLNVQERTEMAEKLGLNEMQIKTWYQNRR